MLYGSAKLSPEGAFEARSQHSFELTYTCGRYGLDDTGSIRIVFRFTFGISPAGGDPFAAGNRLVSN